MKKAYYPTTFIFIWLISMLSHQAIAQGTTISGTITDKATGSTLVGASVMVKGKVIGTTTDNQGRFSLKVNQAPPLTLVFSLVGHQSQELAITDADASGLKITLEEQIIFGQEVVIAASRVEEAVLQSPVSIEKMDIRAIRETPAANFYDALQNLKGVDMSTQSLTFKSVSTRGFNANGNLRVVQLVDGMDNQAPGLNFSVGNILGMSELDVESVELLPGASSALYGPNAINGIILMNSKSPFAYQGLSANAKVGLMNVGNDQVSANPMYDFSARYAKAFNNRFAFKVNFTYLTAKDWHALDYRDRNNLATNAPEGKLPSIPNYNGVNTYGDETGYQMSDVADLMIKAGVLPAAALPLVPVKQEISRTGYLERELVNYNTQSLKLNVGLHYRINDNVEAIIQGNYGTGTTVYTGIDRYSLKGFELAQIKAEVRGSNFFVRAYTTQERSGDSYASGTLGQLINERWKSSELWLPQYVGAFVQARSLGQTEAAAHLAARNFADQGRYAPGSNDFNSAKDDLTSKPISSNVLTSGARFTDKTNLYHIEGMYNFSKEIHFMELIVGANYRLYDLNSAGTLFLQKADGSEYKISEFGGYVQGSKKLLADKLKVTGSVRYDKNQNFAGQFTPRLSAVYTVANNHNFRVSYQTGFRIPPTQDQYIDLPTPQARLIGGLPIFQDKYNMVNNPIYPRQNVQDFGEKVRDTAITPQVLQQAIAIVQGMVQAGTVPNNPAAFAAAVQQVAGGIGIQMNLGLLKSHQFTEFKPERVQSYEIGYKSLIANKLFVDAYYYYNSYTNFSNAQVFVQSKPSSGPANPAALLFANTRNVYRFPVSSTSKTTSQGWALGLDYVLPKGYKVGGNVAYNALESAQANAVTEFNTPKYRTNVTFGNRNVIKNLGFNITWRYQQAFVWQSSFALDSAGDVVKDADGNNVPAYHTFDAQVSYKIPKIKSIFKIGGSNIFNKYYRQAFGNPSVGGLYYVSITFDELLN
ncbi:MAG: TonB-dependent receptor [Bacteroidota bacterium]